MKLYLYVFLLLISSGCVTKARYSKVVQGINSKEKQQVKLGKQLEQLQNTNRILKDSADRIGG